MNVCFVCGKELVYDEATGRYICPLCGNTQSTVYQQTDNN